MPTALPERFDKNQPVQRRQLFSNALSGLALAGYSAGSASEPSLSREQVVTIIDIDRCDGCPDQQVARCVAACRREKAAGFPEPQKPLRPYWPQKKFEDFSEDRANVSRLTPYNYLYIQTLETNGRTVHLPRRCMQCFDAPCRKLCPFGAIDKTPEGAVSINESLCFGGAKCRDVCPWHIPQRQAGVGLYLSIAPTFAGGGVMYKCDHCASRLANGDKPACTLACPQGAMETGPINEMLERLASLQKGRYVYGHQENGGTATWYVSSIPFHELEAARISDRGDAPVPGEPDLKPHPARLDDSRLMSILTLAAPVVAVGAARMLKKTKAPADSSEQTTPHEETKP